MARKKKVFRHKPTQNNYAIYNYESFNNSNKYLDSDGRPLLYDKFSGQDLYTTSTGDVVNEAIMHSKIVNKNSTHDYMSFIGETYFRINRMNK